MTKRERTELLDVLFVLMSETHYVIPHRRGQLTQEELNLLIPLIDSGPIDRQDLVRADPNSPTARVLQKIVCYAKEEGEDLLWECWDKPAEFTNAEAQECLDKPYYVMTWALWQ